MEEEKQSRKSKKPLESKSLPFPVKIQTDFFLPKKPKSSDINKIVMQHFRAGEYQKLMAYLSRRDLLNPDKIKSFFLKKDQGNLLLSWALVQALNDKPIRFLVTMVPNETLQEILRKDNFAVFRGFLYAQVGIEKIGKYDDRIGELQKAKFKILLQIDKNSITNFMDKNAGSEYLQTAIIKTNFKNALEQQSEELNSVMQLS